MEVAERPCLPDTSEEDEEEAEKMKELMAFRSQLSFLDCAETKIATNQICEEMDHDSIYCKCNEDENSEPTPEYQPKIRMIQPDGSIIGKLKNVNCYPVASVFVRNLTLKKKSVLSKSQHDRKKVGSSASRKMENEESIKRRELKKKLFKDLGIVRTKSGIGNQKTNQETEMKRKVADTIVTTYCAPCEQNFSSSKMLLLHNDKVHNTKYLECHLCMHRFLQTILFNRHMKTHYGPNAQRFVKCDLCDRKFKDRESLTTHMNVTHNNEADNS